MSHLHLIALDFASLILVVLLALIQLDDQRAHIFLQKRLFGKRSPPINLHIQRLAPVLETIPVPNWFRDLVNPQSVVWAGLTLSVNQYQSVWWLSCWLGLILGILLAIILPKDLLGALMGLLPLGVGIGGPYYGLQRRIRGRRKDIEKDLPGFLDMLTLAVEAGQGLRQAIQRLVSRSEGTLSTEMRLALFQIDLGCSQQQALRELARRIPSRDLENFVEAILLAEHLGTSLTRTMRIQSDLLRIRRRQRAKVLAQIAPIRIIPALVFFFLPSLLLIYLAPPILNFLLQH